MHQKLPLVLPQKLADGFILRSATQSDIHAIADLNSLVHENEGLGIWLEDAMSSRHPSMDASQVLVITTPDDEIISTLAFIPQTWRYEGIILPVGQLEAITTHENYRRHGFSRKLIETAHQLSYKQGNLIHAVVGIPSYYRRYGYDYALDFRGRRSINLENVSIGIETPPFTIRLATQTDIPHLIRIQNHQQQAYLLTNYCDETRWKFDISGHSDGSDAQVRIFCVLDDQSHIVGYYRTFPSLWDGTLVVIEFAMQVNIPYRLAMLAVLSAMRDRYTDEDGNCHLTQISLEIGTHHAVYDALPDILDTAPRPSAWYIHIPDEAHLIQHIKPILEKRLNESDMRGLTTTTKINLATHELTIHIRHGEIFLIALARLILGSESNANFPQYVFNQLVMGYRNLAEIQYAYPDCLSDTETTQLLNILFPKKPSFVIPLG
ncbi:MAG: GNAT family N-acetyltransferase [Anaerolineae bacterium]|nr:GNAT family N-acetyltransferase [Anaerolineae bacterium]